MRLARRVTGRHHSLRKTYPVQKLMGWKRISLDQGTQRELRIDALYRVAAAAFRRDGYHGTSLIDVATELGVSKPTLYHYIKNKQDLLFQCHLAAADQAIASVCTDETLTGLEQLRTTIRHYVESIIGPTSFSVVVLEERSLSDEQLQTVIGRRDVFDSRVRAVIERGLADGSIRPAEPKLVLFTALGAANWVTKWHRPGGPWSVHEISAGVADLLCDGFRPPDPSTIRSSTLESSDRPQG